MGIKNDNPDGEPEKKENTSPEENSEENAVDNMPWISLDNGSVLKAHMLLDKDGNPIKDLFNAATILGKEVSSVTDNTEIKPGWYTVETKSGDWVYHSVH